MVLALPLLFGIAAAEEPRPLQRYMNHHFVSLLVAVDSLTHGDKAVSRYAFTDLASSALVLPPELSSHQRRLIDAAERGRKAPTYTAASRAVAEVATACGSCHTATEGGPHIQTMDMTAWESASAADRHGWTSDLLLWSLLGDDPPTWVRAADGMLDAAPPVSHAKARPWRKAAESAREATTREQRIAAYAEVLSTCHGCHTR